MMPSTAPSVFSEIRRTIEWSKGSLCREISHPCVASNAIFGPRTRKHRGRRAGDPGTHTCGDNKEPNKALGKYAQARKRSLSGFVLVVFDPSLSARIRCREQTGQN